MNKIAKKILVFIIFFTVSVLFVGCKNNEKNSNTDNINNPVSRPSHSKEAIGENTNEPDLWDSSDN